MKQILLCLLVLFAAQIPPAWCQSPDTIPSMYWFASLGGNTASFPAVGVDMLLVDAGKSSQLRTKAILGVNSMWRYTNTAVVPSVVFGKRHCIEFGAGLVYNLYASYPTEYGGPTSRFQGTLLVAYVYHDASTFFSIGYTPTFGLPSTADERNFMFVISYGGRLLQ